MFERSAEFRSRKIRQIVKDLLEQPALESDSRFNGSLSLEYEDYISRYEFREVIETPSGFKRKKHPNYTPRDPELLRLCERLCKSASSQSGSEGLDSHFSKLFHFYWTNKPSPTDASPEIAREVDSILRRLSQTLLPLPELLGNWSARVLPTKPSSHYPFNPTFIPSSIIRVVSWRIINKFANRPFDSSDHKILTRILNSVGSMIQICTSRSQVASPVYQVEHWLIAKNFLWDFWQRLRALSSYFDVESWVTLGCDDIVAQGPRYHNLMNFTLAQEVSLREHTERLATLGRPHNICKWAFDLLRKDITGVGFDFRLLADRISQGFSGIASRCSLDGQVSCDGGHPDSCRRFKGGQVKDQSMHDGVHDQEQEFKLIWDYESYKAVLGARAVFIEGTNSVASSAADSRRLVYCEASEKTLAISHVWAHGQGGRPEDGLNACLHDMYTRLALSMGCDSYWIDSACIPEDHQLRQEAIGHINLVFRQSRAVVICDRDLMSIDTSDARIHKLEGLLAAILFCDWNIRAWTFLEAVMGRQTIHVLCKDKVVNVKELALHICKHGMVDVAIFISMLQHILPRRNQSKNQSKQGAEELTLETAGSWLSCRPASRPGDDFVIWSLLTRKGVEESASAFWRNFSAINTGFLLSSAERLAIPGLSWAPKSPFAVPDVRTASENSYLFHRPAVSAETEIATIVPEGLWAAWWVHEFNAGFRAKFSSAVVKHKEIHRELEKIRELFSVKRYGALLRPATQASMFNIKHELNNEPSTSTDGVLLIVCVSDKKETKVTPIEAWGRHGWSSNKWIWKGIYVWPSDIPLPSFRRDRSLWIG